MRAKEFINERFLDVFQPYNNKDAEILINPSLKELHKIAPNMVLRGFLTSDDIILWQEFAAIHFQVAEHLKIRGDKNLVPIHISYGIRDVYIMVTDYSKNTNWHHNPELAEYIENHPRLAKKNILDIDYYDSAIVGDWENIE